MKRGGGGGDHVYLVKYVSLKIVLSISLYLMLIFFSLFFSLFYSLFFSLFFSLILSLLSLSLSLYLSFSVSLFLTFSLIYKRYLLVLPINYDQFLNITFRAKTAYLSIMLSIYLVIYLSIYLSILQFRHEKKNNLTFTSFWKDKKKSAKFLILPVAAFGYRQIYSFFPPPFLFLSLSLKGAYWIS